MNVSLYDLLDIDRTAGPDEIRAAWKAAIADLDPTDRRFRAYNEAAAVLLDEDRRAAYDAELAADRPDDDAAEVIDDGADLDEETAPAPVAPTEAPADEPQETTAEVPPEAIAEVPADGDRATGGSDGPPVWALWVAAAAAAISLGLMIAVLLMPGSLGGDSPRERAERADEVEAAGAEAESFAADAIPVVLSYDYRTLDEDFAEAETYLTDDFAAQRTELFAQATETGITLREQVVQDKIVVTARESGTGLTRVSDDGEQATVVVYVDQDSQRGKAAPRSLRMWATLSLVQEDGEWLLDDICTESDCS